MAEIIAALIGAFAAVIGAKLFNDWRDARSMRASLAAELRAILEAGERRQYVQTLTRFAQSLPETPSPDVSMGPFRPFIVHVRHDYRQVFSAVVGRIGLLPPRTSEAVVSAYYHAQMLLEDFELGTRAARGEQDSIWILHDYQTFRNFNVQCAALAVEARRLVRDAINLLDSPPS